MTTLEAEDPAEFRAGLPGNPLLKAYAGFLREVETNPQNYTWLMDWYYRP